MYASNIFTDEEIVNIYNNEYIKEHTGGTSLNKKYNCDFYHDFSRLNLELRNDREKSRKYSCNVNYFKDIDTEEKAYWLGFCYADGYIIQNGEAFGLSIGKVDHNHLKKFKDAIEYTGPINEYTVAQGYKIGTEYVRVIIRNIEFTQNIISHGCVEKKSNILKPPTGVPDNLIKHFIRGFMDANGCIHVTQRNQTSSYEISFCSTDDVLNWIQNFLLKEGVINRLYPLEKRKEEQIVSSFKFGGNFQVKKYLDYIYKDSHIWLERKYQRYFNLCNIINQREANKRINICAYCGTQESSAFYKWNGDGEYHDKILCGKHYQQLRKYGRIIPDKSDRCDICGEKNGRLTQIGPKNKEFHGMTLCLKHYNQLQHYGTITDECYKKKDSGDEN